MKRNFYFLPILFFALLLTSNIKADHLTKELFFSAMLNGQQEVPSTPTDGKGVASVRISATRDTAWVLVSATDLSGPITAAHIHIAPEGINGPPIIDLTPSIKGNLIEFRATNFTKENLTNLLKGMMYVNLHTSQYPDGEIRGQLHLETDWLFEAKMDTTQETTPVLGTTNGYGLGTFNLLRSGQLLRVDVVVQNLTGPIAAAHIHKGAINQSGPPVINLTRHVSGNRIIADIDVSSMTAGFIDSLKSGLTYVNVHTEINPQGEVRGQLLLNPQHLMFESQLMPPQVVNSLGFGVASIKVTPTLDTLYYDIVTDNINTPITAAHFHLKSTGAPVITLTGISGNRIQGMYTGLTSEQLNDMMVGNYYINVHNRTYPDGEISGDVYKVAREGYGFIISGSAMTNPKSMGSGTVSIDTRLTDVVYKVAVDSLTGPIVASHFHYGRSTETGPIIFDITPSFINNFASGFWTANTPTTPLTQDIGLKFAHDTVYVNIHTENYPNGEARGEVSNLNTLGMVTSLYYQSITNDLQVYYTNNSLNINGNKLEGSFYHLLDVSGKEVLKGSLQEASNKIDLNQINYGLYFIKITGNVNGSFRILKH